MLSIADPAKGGSGGGYYFRYYTREAHERGFWLGRGADSLELPPEVSELHLNNILEGFSPDGSQKLVQNAGSAKRQGFWDLTFSVPKSLSVLYMAAPALRPQILDACETALREVLGTIDETLGQIRGEGPRRHRRR